jgi:hypothetical protein
MLAGALSQWLRSRRRAIGLYLLLALAAICVFLTLRGLSAPAFYALCAVMGFSFGYWAMIVTVASEQFGTNLRATVTTTVPNFIRGSLTPMTWAFLAFKLRLGLLPAAACVGVGALGLAFLSLWKMEESFGRDLDYFESL